MGERLRAEIIAFVTTAIVGNRCTGAYRSSIHGRSGGAKRVGRHVRRRRGRLGDDATAAVCRSATAFILMTWLRCSQRSLSHPLRPPRSSMYLGRRLCHEPRAALAVVPRAPGGIRATSRSPLRPRPGPTTSLGWCSTMRPSPPATAGSHVGTRPIFSPRSPRRHHKFCGHSRPRRAKRSVRNRKKVA